MSDQSKRSWRFRLPGWLTTRLYIRKLRREIRELDSHFETLLDGAKSEADEHGISNQWHSMSRWPESELARFESAKLQRLAKRWNIDSPSYKHDAEIDRWYIPAEPREKLWREIRAARRENIRWWIKVVAIPLIITLVTALIALFSRPQ